MKFKRLHGWKVSPRQAILIQKELAQRIITGERIPKLRKIAACDIGYTSTKGQLLAAIAIFNFPQLKLIEKTIKKGKVDFPYIPGLLTFREGPLLLEAFSTINYRPDLVIFDGQGIAHPRKMGLATHMGILLDIPTIGCAKSFLYGSFEEPGIAKGAYSYIRDNHGQVIGAALRTRNDVRCIFVSVGYRISLEEAIRIILTCSPKFRIPEPLRVAHNLSQSFKG